MAMREHLVLAVVSVFVVSNATAITNQQFYELLTENVEGICLSVSLSVTVCLKLPPALQSGPSCSKLTMSLVNASLKFKMAILQIHCLFLLKKCENPLYCKGFSHFFNKK